MFALRFRLHGGPWSCGRRRLRRAWPARCRLRSSSRSTRVSAGRDLDHGRRRHANAGRGFSHARSKARNSVRNSAIFAPKFASPSSSALNSTSGARSRPPRSSTMRTPPSGRACPAQCCQTPRFFSISTLLGRSAVVRRSASAAGRDRRPAPRWRLLRPDAARARAAASPAGSSADHRHLGRLRAASWASVLLPLFGRPCLARNPAICAMDWQHRERCAFSFCLQEFRRHSSACRGSGRPASKNNALHAIESLTTIVSICQLARKCAIDSIRFVAFLQHARWTKVWIECFACLPFGKECVKPTRHGRMGPLTAVTPRSPRTVLETVN